MDSEREAFLATIRENTEDRAPIGIYADWHEERGNDMYAAMLRQQCDVLAGAKDKITLTEGQWLKYGPELYDIGVRKIDTGKRPYLYTSSPSRLGLWFCPTPLLSSSGGSAVPPTRVVSLAVIDLWCWRTAVASEFSFHRTQDKKALVYNGQTQLLSGRRGDEVGKNARNVAFSEFAIRGHEEPQEDEAEADKDERHRKHIEAASDIVHQLYLDWASQKLAESYADPAIR